MIEKLNLKEIKIRINKLKKNPGRNYYELLYLYQKLITNYYYLKNF